MTLGQYLWQIIWIIPFLIILVKGGAIWSDARFGRLKANRDKEDRTNSSKDNI